MPSAADIHQGLEAACEEAQRQEEEMLQEVAEAEEVEQLAEEERRHCEEEERQRAEEERRRAEEKAEEERKQVEVEWEEAKQLRDSLESFEKGLWTMSAEETAKITVEWAWKVWLGEGSSEQGLCWHCWSWKTACI